MEIILKYFADFTEKQYEQFQALGPFYREWNEKINVISRKDIDSLYEKHILHSLALAAIINFESGAKVVDIGTGGGFPGIPLAIQFPDVQFVLADSIRKKLKVVEEIAGAIGLQNITVYNGRVETLAPESFDYAISRAVAPLGQLWQWIRPILRKGRQTTDFSNGLFCLKGGDLTEEINTSGLRPHIWKVHDIFPEPYFEEKFVLYVPR